MTLHFCVKNNQISSWNFFTPYFSSFQFPNWQAFHPAPNLLNQRHKVVKRRWVLRNGCCNISFYIIRSSIFSQSRHSVYSQKWLLFEEMTMVKRHRWICFCLWRGLKGNHFHLWGASTTCSSFTFTRLRTFGRYIFWLKKKKNTVSNFHTV